MLSHVILWKLPPRCVDHCSLGLPGCYIARLLGSIPLKTPYMYMHMKAYIYTSLLLKSWLNKLPIVLKLFLYIEPSVDEAMYSYTLDKAKCNLTIHGYGFAILNCNCSNILICKWHFSSKVYWQNSIYICIWVLFNRNASKQNDSVIFHKTNI